MAYDADSAEKALKLLPKEVLLEIRTIATTAKANFQKLKFSRNALIDSIDISLIPLKSKRDALDAQIKSAKESTQIIPVETVAMSPQLGQINTDFEAALVGQIEGASNIVFEIDRQTSVRFSVGSEIAQYSSSMAFLDSVVASIDKVLSTP